MTPWVPISKDAVRLLPNNRSFTELEALFSIQLNHNNAIEVSVSGMAARFGWSRKKVRCFLNRIGIEVSYPESTSKNQNQRGQIRGQIRDRSKEKRGQINFIDYNDLQCERDRSEEKRGQIRDRSGATINEKEKENKKITSFSKNEVDENAVFYLTKKGKKLSGSKLQLFNQFWTAFNWKKGKAAAADVWLKIPGLNESLADTIIQAAKGEAKGRPDLIIAKGLTPKMAEGWLSERRWEDWEDEGPGKETSQPENELPWI